MALITTADGTRLAVHDLGGRGPSLLLVHGTGLHGRVWQPVADALAEDFHCWSLDLRGHGDSTPPPDPPHDWTGFVRDILAVVDHLGLHGGVAVGHSMGGANLLDAAATRPGTFAGLWVYEPVVFAGGDGEAMTRPSVEMALRRREVFASSAEAESRYGSRPPFSAITPEALRAYVEHGFAAQPDGTVRLKCRNEVEAGVFSGFPRSGIVDRLGDITCPVFLAGGVPADAPPGTTIRDAPLAVHLRHPQVLLLRGVDHFAPLQDPGLVAGSIRTSLRGLGPSHPIGTK